MIYETKGLTLEQVDELYAEVSDARQSLKWVPTITFTELQDDAGKKGHSALELKTHENAA